MQLFPRFFSRKRCVSAPVVYMMRDNEMFDFVLRIQGVVFLAAVFAQMYYGVAACFDDAIQFRFCGMAVMGDGIVSGIYEFCVLPF